MKKKPSLTSIFSLFATGITIITNGTRKSNYFGCTINSFTSVSLNPPMFLFCLGNENKNLKTFRIGSPLNVNFLSHSQKKLSNKFAHEIDQRWLDTKYLISKNKVPFFKESLGIIEGKVLKKIKFGDHYVIICQISDFYKMKLKKPLIYYKSKYQTF